MKMSKVPLRFLSSPRLTPGPSPGADAWERGALLKK